MKRILLTATVLAAIAGGGFAFAQSPGPSADDHAAHHPAKAAPKAAAPTPQAGTGQSGIGSGTTGNGMMGGGGNGMMGGGGNGMMAGGMMGGGMCPMVMGSASTKVDVKKVDKGVTITMTSSDAPTVARLQKMADAMRLMHEAMTQ